MTENYFTIDDNLEFSRPFARISVRRTRRLTFTQAMRFAPLDFLLRSFDKLLQYALKAPAMSLVFKQQNPNEFEIWNYYFLFFIFEFFIFKKIKERTAHRFLEVLKSWDLDFNPHPIEIFQNVHYMDAHYRCSIVRNCIQCRVVELSKHQHPCTARLRLLNL